jgi:hypothetical protein
MVAHVAALEPGHRGENRAADDVGVQQAPGDAREPGREALEHVLGELRAEEDLAHPHEQRQRGEGPRRERSPDGHRHRIPGRAHGEKLHADPGDPHQRETDPQPAAQQHEEQHDE